LPKVAPSGILLGVRGVGDFWLFSGVFCYHQRKCSDAGGVEAGGTAVLRVQIMAVFWGFLASATRSGAAEQLHVPGFITWQYLGKQLELEQCTLKKPRLAGLLG